MSERVENATAPDNSNKDGWLDKLKPWLPMVTAILPAVVTAVFGFIIWNAQTAIQERIDKNNRLLEQQKAMQVAQFQTQLSLKEMFYKRRLDVYEKACQQIADTVTLLGDPGLTEKDLKRAPDSVAAIDQLRRGNQLYWSGQIDQRLSELWELGIRKLRLAGESDTEQLNEEIANEIKQLHAQMKLDLYVPEMSRILEEAGKDSQAEN